VTICSILGGAAPVSPQSIDLTDEENKLFWESPESKALVENTKPLEEYNGADFDVVLYVGGCLLSDFLPLLMFLTYDVP